MRKWQGIVWCDIFIAVYFTFTCLRVASKIKHMAEQLSPWKWRLELLLLFFALLLFFSSAVRQRGRAQLGITLFYLFLDDIVEPQIVSLWESCIVFNTLKVLQKKNICMRSMTALKFVCKQALKSNKAQLYFLISTGAHNFALKNIFVIWLLP